MSCEDSYIDTALNDQGFRRIESRSNTPFGSLVGSMVYSMDTFGTSFVGNQYHIQINEKAAEAGTKFIRSVVDDIEEVQMSANSVSSFVSDLYDDINTYTSNPEGAVYKTSKNVADSEFIVSIRRFILSLFTNVKTVENASIESHTNIKLTFSKMFSPNAQIPQPTRAVDMHVAATTVALILRLCVNGTVELPSDIKSVEYKVASMNLWIHCVRMCMHAIQMDDAEAAERLLKTRFYSCIKVLTVGSSGSSRGVVDDSLTAPDMFRTSNKPYRKRANWTTYIYYDKNTKMFSPLQNTFAFRGPFVEVINREYHKCNS